ncbi:putative monovalent cation/H+ antiporter subunit D [Pyrococcus sp. NA2]|uniref:proton-conducting transporter transmembrane domain-containing protein n=1 Tax=Pyrococcus sp. (strain NA2) TaxID=342949 RepID=UPI000209AA17|nr:proton-conducting transporter membrane subunit [Pyrococcus sp. NA2]AEC52537.1 putative monovalent cation/H+ antiporter subunit D [Pyrococcus sp. NA2]
MNASILSLIPAIFSVLIYLLGTLKIEGSVRAKFRLPLIIEAKILYSLGVFLPMMLLPVVKGGVVGGYPKTLGIEVGVDRISLIFLIAEFAVFGTSSLYFLDKAKEWRELTLLLLVHSGLIGAFISKDLFNFYVFMELSSVSSYALIASSREEGSKEAAFKYLILSMTASYIFILSLGMIYFQTGYLNVELASKAGLKSETPLRLAALALTLKAGIFPLHIWLPDAHSKAKTHVSSILSGIAVKAPIYGLILLSKFGDLSFLKLLAISSMIFGVVMAILQVDAKRLLAYHTVSQMGYVLLGIANSNLLAAALYSFAHATFKSGLFLAIGSLVDARKKRDLKYLGARDNLALLISVAILSLAIAGFGPTIGGVAKSFLKEDKLIVYAVSFGTAFSFSKLNYYLWTGYGNNPSFKRIFPSLILMTIVILSGIMLGGKASIFDLLIPGAAFLFYGSRKLLKEREYAVILDVNEGIALFSLLLATFLVI